MTEYSLGKGAERALFGAQISERAAAAAASRPEQASPNGRDATSVISERGLRAFRTDVTAAMTGTGTITGLPLPGGERAPRGTVRQHLLAGLADVFRSKPDGQAARPAARPLQRRPAPGR